MHACALSSHSCAKFVYIHAKVFILRPFWRAHWCVVLKNTLWSICGSHACVRRYHARTKRSTPHATQHEATLHNIAHYVAIPRLVFAGLPLLSAVDRHSLTTCGTVLCICVVREFVLCIDCGSGCRGYAASAAAASLRLLLPLVPLLLLGGRRM